MIRRAGGALLGRRRRTTVRRIRTGGVVALVAFVLAIGLATRFIVNPSKDPLPVHADVVFVLGPATVERTMMARALVRRGIASNVLVSIPADARVPGTWDYRRFHGCIPQAGTSSFCEYAEPHTTRGEAQMLRRYAEQHDWRSAIVVTQTSHLERARLIIGRCFAGTITMRSSGEAPYRGWGYQIAYQTAATVKAWILQGC